MSADQTPVVEATACDQRQAAMPFDMATVLIDMISVASFETTAAAPVGACVGGATAFGFGNLIGSLRADMLPRSVADAPRGDRRPGLPYALCAALQRGAMAMTVLSFRRLHADTTGTPAVARP